MNKETLPLVVVFLGVMMGAVDTTIVILALPTMAAGLKANLSIMIWTIILYILVVAVTTTQLGRLGDMMGRGRIYNLGFVVFTAGSALCGAAPNALTIVGFRGVQGFGAAMMQANSGAIIADVFPPARRGRAYGYTSIGWNTGATLGILLGGIITTFIGWRYIFYINVPIGVVSTIIGVRVLKSGKVEKRKMDLAGLVVLVASLTAITYGAADIADEGLVPFNTTLIVLGLLLLIPFYIIENKVSNPMIDFRAFRNRILSYSLLASFFQSSGYLATAFILIMYLQGIRGLTPFNASLLLVPGYVLASIVAPFSGRLSDRIGARIPATAGIALMMLAAAFYFLLQLKTPFGFVVAATVVGGLGSALFFPANNSAVMASASTEFRGGASGLMRTLSNMGTLASYVVAISVASTTVPRYVAFQVFLGTSNLIGGVAKDFLTGIHSAFLASLVILTVALVFSAVRGRETREVVERRSAGTFTNV
ncbi:MAG: MFS transporter [Thermoprotei archaeon]